MIYNTRDVLQGAGMLCFPSKWVRFGPNATNLGLFKISFSTVWLAEPKCTETDLKKCDKSGT